MLTIFSTLLLFSNIIQRDTIKFIQWDNNRHLSSADFRRKPPAKPESVAQGLFILNMDFEFDESSFEFRVQTLFIKDSSWVTPEAKSLNHLEYIFDLYEVYARLMRKEFLSMNKGSSQTIEENLSLRTKEYLKMIKQECAKFDSQSSFGFDNEYEIKWETDIKSRLNKLKEYSYTDYKNVNIYP